MKPLLANNKFQHSLTVRLISSLKFASGGSKRRNGSHSGKQDSSHEYYGSSSTAEEEGSTQSLSHLCHMLSAGRGRIVKIVKYHSQIYACGVVPSGREPNNSYFLKIACDSFSVCFRLALSDDLYFHIFLIH